MQKIFPIARQVIVINGADGPVGRSISQLAADLGAKVAVLCSDLKSVERVRNSGKYPLCLQADASSVEELQKAAQEVLLKLGPICAWVNNTLASLGTELEEPIEEIAEKPTFFTEEFWEVVHGSRVAVEYMSANRQGSIINIARPALKAKEVPLKHRAIEGVCETLRREQRRDRKSFSITLIKPLVLAASEEDLLWRSESPHIAKAVAEAVVCSCEIPTQEIIIEEDALSDARGGDSCVRVTHSHLRFGRHEGVV